MIATLGLWLGLSALAAGPEDRPFREEIAPILERRCIHCHGEVGRKGGLTLATREGALRGGEGGPAVVPGRPEESPLLEMVAGDPPEMPLKEPPLSPPEVGRIREWIRRGAPWPDGLVLKERRFDGERWWAFEPLKRPKVPDVSAGGWARTPVDRFILAGLERKGLSPSPEADRRALIRRLSFDLLGLPPSPDEVDDFLADGRPDAYERLVDRLLASPHYGERWGRHWLDVVHYGDTHGYDKDKRRDHAWPYRDYVISAFNSDLPYGRFVREQLAGDVLWPGEPRGVIATGFVAAGPWDFVGHVELREGTVDKLKARLNDRDDMLSNTMSTFQSLTVHCARCHDHKFDPIPQSDYYRIQAVFAGVDRGDRPYQDPELDRRRRALEEDRDALRDRLKGVQQAIAASLVGDPGLRRIDEELVALRRRLAESRPPASGPPSPSNGYHSAVYPSADTTTWVQVDLGASLPIEEIRLVPARPVDFPDTAGFGFPPRFRVEAGDDPGFAPGRGTKVAEMSRPDLLNVEDEPLVIRPGGISARYVRVTATRLWKRSNDYVFALGELEVDSGGRNRARGAAVSSPDALRVGRWAPGFLVDGHDSRRAIPDAADPAYRTRRDRLLRAQELEKGRAAAADSAIPPDLKARRDELSGAIARLEAEIQGLPKGPVVYGLVPHAPRPIHELRRGDVEQPGKESAPGALGCVPGLPGEFSLGDSADEGARRAALAEWLASPANVLTWRSIANRVWQYHFGRGIVDTPGDFGRNGSKPTHPELLDWLALELLEGGQSLKSLHRTIVASAAYRQASGPDPAKERVDAENRLLWRQNRRKVEAEVLRDSVLAASGTLDRRMGGPGFDLFRFKDDHSPVYDHTDPEKADYPDARRRTVYRFAVRSVPNPFLEALDSADPNLNTPVRSQTLTALQALALYNDVFMVRQSQEFARSLEALAGDPSSRIDLALRRALGRPARPGEREALADYAARYGLDHACRLIFNTNEFVFID